MPAVLHQQNRKYNWQNYRTKLLAAHQVAVAVKYEAETYQIQETHHHHNIHNCAAGYFWLRCQVLHHQFNMATRLKL